MTINETIHCGVQTTLLRYSDYNKQANTPLMSIEFSDNNKKKESLEDENVVLKIILQRHGPKLDAAGEKNVKAEYFVDSVKAGFQKAEVSEGEGLVHVSTSPVSRAIDTAEIDQDELGNTQKRTKNFVTKKTALEVPFQPSGEAPGENYVHDLDLIIKLQKGLEPEIREQVNSESEGWSEEEVEAEVRNRIDTEVNAANGNFNNIMNITENKINELEDTISKLRKTKN